MVDHLLARMDRFTTRLGREMADRTQGSGIARGSEGRILSLVGDDGVRPTALASGAWITKQAVGKRVQELAARGLVEAVPDPSDGRAVLVRRTPAGAALVRDLDRRIAGLERDLAEEVGAERFATFLEVLDELGVH